MRSSPASLSPPIASRFVAGVVGTLAGAAFALLSMAAPVSGEPFLEKVDIFAGGDGGYASYRIPGIAVTARGTVLAYAEARRKNAADWGEIDVLLRRSTDGGRTWTPPQHVAHRGERIPRNPVVFEKQLGSDEERTVNNPVAIADHTTGTIHFHYCVDYGRCFYQRSEDDGGTFSAPVEITKAFETFRTTYDWKVLATGPGHGLQLRNGRLLVPVWLSLAMSKNAHHPSVAATIFSDDDGRTWQAGEIAVPATEEWKDPNETTAVQLASGEVMLNVRNQSAPNRRIVVTSPDGATGWSKPRFDDALLEPVCMASIVRFPDAKNGGKNRLLFSNPHNLARKDGKETPGGSRDRKNLTIKLSEDEGATWPVSKALEEGPSMYSDLAVLPDGTALCFYERGKLLTLARFNLEWLTTPGPQRFSFGEGPAAVTPETGYTAERGFGFDLGSPVSAPPGAGCVTSERPFFFSVALPEGNYRVVATLGDAAGESATTVKAESRRLMLESVKTKAGEFTTQTFTVNVRTPQIAGGGAVRLKARERGVLQWDEKLTLEFNGARPCLRALEIVKVEDAVTVYVAGDSTVTDQPNEPWNSWGQMLTRFFQPGVAVANHADSGESVKSSLEARRFDKIWSTMKKGDYLLIQFGHNDQKDRREGAGAFTTYRAALEGVLAKTRDRGGLPVLITSMYRRNFDASGQLQNNLGDFPEAVRQIAREQQVPLIDLHAMSKPFYEALGPEKSKKAFVDNTHHNAYGSYELAKCIVEGIKSAKLDLANHLATNVAPFDPAHPDPVETFAIPASPQATTTKPDGN